MIALLALLCAAVPPPLAIVGGRILPVSGPPIEVGTVLIRGEQIEAVGPNVVIPPGAELIHAEGRWVTPGLIESHTQLGVHEISALTETVDASASTGDAIHAALRMEEGINPRSALIPVARRHGVTSAIVTPVGGLISGRSPAPGRVPAAPRASPRPCSWPRRTSFARLRALAPPPGGWRGTSGRGGRPAAA